MVLSPIQGLENIRARVTQEFAEYGGPWLYYLMALYVCLPFLAYYLIPAIAASPMRFTTRRSVSLFVLGDVGHSPRMRYHALSFSKYNYVVNLAGYVEKQSELPFDIVDDPNIDVVAIPVVKNLFGAPFVVFAAYKIVVQTMYLVRTLFGVKGSNYIVIQNPPLMPLLLVVVVFIRVFSRSTRLIIDWHNLNYTILNLKYNNEKHPLVRLLRMYEKYLSRAAYLHITVTDQMKTFLVEEFGLKRKNIITLHDRPNERFQPLESVDFDVNNNQELADECPHVSELLDSIPGVESYSILVSSTSFTPDEDFNILLDALQLYQDDRIHNSLLPPILCIITGKGPMKEQFLARVTELAFDPKSVIIRNVWLDPEEYPVMLAMAKLGVSLHTSSSGIDLPMKIVDMFGCGVPVISLQFPAIGELVKDGVNGLVTDNEKDPSKEVHRLLKKAFSDKTLYDTIKKGAMEETKLRWDQNWRKKLGSLFDYEKK